MTEQQVKDLFLKGVEAFREGQPQPENRIEYLGWKAARKAQQEIDEGLETALEAYVERGYQKK